jgi:hypothetical protein
VTTYASQAAAPLSATAQALYAEIVRQSAGMAERLALLGQHGKTGAPPAAVDEVRQRLWAEFDPGPPRRGYAAGGRGEGAHRATPGGSAREGSR